MRQLHQTLLSGKVSRSDSLAIAMMAAWEEAAWKRLELCGGDCGAGQIKAGQNNQDFPTLYY